MSEALDRFLAWLQRTLFAPAAPPVARQCPECGYPPFARTLPHGEGEVGCRRCGAYVQAGGGISDAIRAWNEGAE